MKISANAVLVFFLCVVTASAYAITPGKEKDINTLQALMGNSSMAEEMANTMVSISISQEKKRYPNMSKKVEHTLSQAIYDVVTAHAYELDEMMIPLYDKYYTHQEIKDLIVFFNTPTGKKYASVLTPMMQDIVPIAQEWGLNSTHKCNAHPCIHFVRCLPAQAFAWT
jgi:hypothetical protein